MSSQFSKDSKTIIHNDNQKKHKQARDTKVMKEMPSSNGCPASSRVQGHQNALILADTKSGMPLAWNPTITLLQKKREGSIPQSRRKELQVGDVFKTPGLDVPPRMKAINKEKTSKRYHAEDWVIDNQQTVKDLTDKIQSAVDKEKELEMIRKLESVLEESSTTRSQNLEKAKNWSPPSASYRTKRYENRPLKIENYEPGLSSLALQESRVSQLYNPPIDKPGELCKYTEGSPEFKYRIKKKEQSISPTCSEPSIHDLYKRVHKGGDIPVEGLRALTPIKNVRCSRSVPPWEGPQTCGDQYNIRHSISSLSGLTGNRRRRDEINLARKREMELIIAEERRKRLEKESRINEARRHSDFLTWKSKSPVALDRYSADEDTGLFVMSSRQTRCNVRSKARVIYSFHAQNNRELSLRKEDIVYLLRQIDGNWFEGEHHGTVGIFPVNYVEVLASIEEAHKASVLPSGRVRAKYSFEAQNAQELSLNKGETITILRQIDNNWFEGRVGNQQGIFPVAYIERTTDPSAPRSTGQAPSGLSEISLVETSLGTLSSLSSELSPSSATSASPINSYNSTERGWNSAEPRRGGSLTRQPNSSLDPHGLPPQHTTQRDKPPDTDSQHTWPSSWKQGYRSRPRTAPVQTSCDQTTPVQTGYDRTNDPYYDSLDEYGGGAHGNSSDGGTIDDRYMPLSMTASDPGVAITTIVEDIPVNWRQKSSSVSNAIHYTPYQAVFTYRPCDEDELSLLPGDIVFVTETFDDGWFVGISQRTNDFGTFPGNYVQKLRIHELQDVQW